MDTWSAFFTMTGGLLFFALLIMTGGWFDERRDRRQREAEDAAKAHPAE